MALIALAFAVLQGSPRTALAARALRPMPDARPAPVAVGPGFPIVRDQPYVIAHRAPIHLRVRPTLYLPLALWRPVAVRRVPAERLAWRDSEPLAIAEGWTETSFDCNQPGRHLDLELVSGRVQIDFIEVVFENGDCQVIDFANRSHAPGVYSLLDLGEVRTVDHVRVIARARSDMARIALMLRR
ncbi:MAG TPA: hypothetical protein VMI75_23000 [Polyangiaceae bacterium]|nr:hypothetical protein [Polyangiaceae bacterium]